MLKPTPGLIVEYEHSGAHFAVATADGYPAAALCEVSTDQYGNPSTSWPPTPPAISERHKSHARSA